MESKHFSHNHALAFHQVPQGSEIQCSACKSPASGNAYACWQCSHFLHEQCFLAARSLKHPSHPLHPLTLLPFPTYPSGSFVCNTCNHSGDGFSYTCSQCEFDIHVHCALMPTPNPHVSPSPLPAHYYNSQPLNPLYPPPPPHNAAIPQSTSYPPPIPNSPFPNDNPNATPQSSVSPVNAPTTYPPPPWASETNSPQPKPATIIKHFSHPHVLNSMEIKEKSGKACSACMWEVSGPVYTCTEPNCSFILDKACFDAPREIHHKYHPQHPLILMTGGSFDCNACWRSGKDLGYTCLTCNISLHIDCVDWDETVPAGVAHQHALTLYYSAAEGSGEDASIQCDACEDPVEEKAWRYYCRECGVGLHTGCRYKRYNESGGGTQDDIHTQLFKLKRQQMINNFTLQMSHQNAKFMTSLANSWKNF